MRSTPSDSWTAHTAGPALQIASGQGIHFPVDLVGWVSKENLYRFARAAASRGCGDSWMNLAQSDSVSGKADDLLVLMAYCYLQGMYHSIDIARRLDIDPVLVHSELTESGVRPEQIRRFRREHRRALTDCLTHALVAIWQDRTSASHPASGVASSGMAHNRVNFSFLEPFYLQAQDRVDRAVVLDSMALDY